MKIVNKLWIVLNISLLILAAASVSRAVDNPTPLHVRLLLNDTKKNNDKNLVDAVNDMELLLAMSRHRGGIIIDDNTEKVQLLAARKEAAWKKYGDAEYAFKYNIKDEFETTAVYNAREQKLAGLFIAASNEYEAALDDYKKSDPEIIYTDICINTNISSTIPIQVRIPVNILSAKYNADERSMRIIPGPFGKYEYSPYNFFFPKIYQISFKVYCANQLLESLHIDIENISDVDTARRLKATLENSPCELTGEVIGVRKEYGKLETITNNNGAITVEFPVYGTNYSIEARSLGITVYTE